MTNSLVVDDAALRAVVGHVATIADEVSDGYVNQLAELSAPVADALAGSAVSQVGGSPQAARELQRLGEVLHDWLHTVNRSAAVLAELEEANTRRFG
jgi:hypothetical protein